MKGSGIVRNFSKIESPWIKLSRIDETTAQLIHRKKKKKEKPQLLRKVRADIRETQAHCQQLEQRVLR